MTYALPTKTDLNGTPSEGTFKTAFGVLYDYISARLGGGSVSASTSEQRTARDSLGVPCVNWVINPDGEIAQALPASSADGDYDFDQWIALTQTGSVASTQISNPEDGYRYGMRMTQSQASAQRMGRIQIIEGKDAIKLRGKTVTYGGRRRLSSSANIRLAIVEWTGTEDSAVKDVVNDWTSGTYTTGNFFKSTTTTVVATAQVAMTAATARDCSVSGTISSSATNILVFEWTESTVAQNVTFDAWGSRLIEASSLIDYIRRTYAQELELCKRFLRKSYSDGTAPGSVTQAGAVRAFAAGNADFYGCGMMFFGGTMRNVPSLTFYNPVSGSASSLRDETGGANVSITPSTVKIGTNSSDLADSGLGLTAGRFYGWHWVAKAQIGV